jgi:Na+/H+ antiporter NhaD/arsenite permease-like protein
MWLALAIFVFTYLVILGQKIPYLHLDRPSGAATGAVLMVVFGVVTPNQVYEEAVNWETLVLLLGMMILSAYLAEAGFFRWASWRAIHAAKTPRRLLAGVTLVCAGLSALLVNDTVCLMVTPLVLQVVEDAELPPLPYLLAVAFGANAGSAATPTGNPQNMIVATLSGISYADFTASLAPAALVATIVVLGVLLWMFRADLQVRPLGPTHVEPPPVDRPLLAKAVIALVGVVIGFFAGADLAWTAMAGAAFLLLFGARVPRNVFARVDWVLLLFFAGLFVVVYAVGKTGAADAIFAGIAPYATGSAWKEAAVLGSATVVLSNVFSNVPFVLLAAHWIPEFADPDLAWKVLALTSTLAGNLTIVGSVANVIVLELAGRHGEISFGRFLRYGLPVTAFGTAAGTIVLVALR